MKRKIDQVINIAGILPPQSIFLVARALEKIGEEGVVEVISYEKDPWNLLIGLPPEEGYKVIETKKVHGVFHYTIMKNSG